jgi:hypothetical protein
VREITMSVNQFFEMENGNISLEDIIRNNNLEHLATKIMNNKKLRRFTVTFIAMANMYTTSFAKTTNDKQGGDVLRNFILSNSLISHEYKILGFILLCIIILFSLISSASKTRDYFYYFEKSDTEYYLEQKKGLYKWLKFDTIWTGFIFSRQFLNTIFLNSAMDIIEIGFGIFGIAMIFIILWCLNDIDRRLYEIKKGGNY